MKLVKKGVAVVYFAAGISSRFGGKIKQFAKIDSKGKTLIEHSLDQAIKSNPSKIVFIVGNKTEKPFKEKFKDSYKGIPVSYAPQKYDKKTRNRPWGTVDALCSAKPLLKEGFIVCNGDDIYGESPFKILADHLKSSKEEAIVSYKLDSVVPRTGTVNRGILKSKKGYVKGIKDSFNISRKDLISKKIKKNICSMNIFALHKKTLRLLNKRLKKFKKKNKGDRDIEYRLPHAISELIKKGKIKMKIYPATEKWIGVTNPGDEKKVREFIGKNS